MALSRIHQAAFLVCLLLSAAFLLQLSKPVLTQLLCPRQSLGHHLWRELREAVAEFAWVSATTHERVGSNAA